MAEMLLIDCECYCVLATFLGEKPYLALADGTIRGVDGGNAVIEVPGGIAAAACSLGNRQILTGGEEGQIHSFDADGELAQLCSLQCGPVASVAGGDCGVMAFACRKQLFTRSSTGEINEQAYPHSIWDLAFSPDSKFLAVSSYNQVWLHATSTYERSKLFQWNGVHRSVSFSPDGKYIVTTMQEKALHCWRIEDGKDIEMLGYPARVRSLSWSPSARWLATSGAVAAIVWPFLEDSGPMGTVPSAFGSRRTSLVTCVSCHPHESVLALGYDDGEIVLIYTVNGGEVLLRGEGRGSITNICWNERGDALLFGSESGDCGLVILA